MRSIRIAVFMATAIAASSVNGQVVQLPTFRQFSIGTTVVVPDRGATYLGGVSRRRAASSTYGIPGLGPLTRNRAFGVETGGSHAWATATIHDFEAMDRALLGDGVAGRPPATETERRAAFLVRHLGRRGSSRVGEVRSVAEIRSTTRAKLARESIQRKPR